MKKTVSRYFPHDIDTNEDEKIMDMLFYFKTCENNFNKNMLQYTALGLYWTIVQYLHIKNIPQDKIDIFADKWQVDKNFLKSILEKFGLFKIKNGNYISERVLKNIQEIEEKSERGKRAISSRWKNNSNEKEKEKIKKAQKELSDGENILIHMNLTNYDCYRTLKEYEQLQAVNFYKSQINCDCSEETAIKNTLEYIEKGVLNFNE